MYCFLVLLHTKACGFYLQPLASHYKKDAKNGIFCSYNTWYHLRIRTLILATIECGCIQLCVLEFVNFLLRGCRCSSICVAKHEFEKVQRFVLVFAEIQVQVNSKFSFDIFGG